MNSTVINHNVARDTALNALGLVGESIHLGSDIPQIYHCYKRKSAKDLSFISLAGGFIGSVFVVTYGAYFNLLPVYGPGCSSIIMHAVLLGQKLYYDKFYYEKQQGNQDTELPNTNIKLDSIDETEALNLKSQTQSPSSQI